MCAVSHGRRTFTTRRTVGAAISALGAVTIFCVVIPIVIRYVLARPAASSCAMALKSSGISEGILRNAVSRTAIAVGTAAASTAVRAASSVCGENSVTFCTDAGISAAARYRNSVCAA